MVKYEKFRNTIFQVINASELDAGVVLYILKDIIHEIEPLYRQEVQKEIEAEQKEVKEESE